MFPLFSFIPFSISPALKLLYLPILYYKHPIPSTPANCPLPRNPHPHLPHPHHHSPPCLTLDPPFPFLSLRTCPCPSLHPPCPALRLHPNHSNSSLPERPLRGL